MPSIPYKKRKKGSWTRDKNITKQYNSARWKRIRRQGLVAEPFCAEHLKDGVYVLANVRDHKKQVSEGGDFWDTENHQSLCTPCHNSKSAKESHKHR